MKIVTIATKYNPGYQRLLDSCDHFDIPIQNLGEGNEYKGHGTKAVLLQRYMNQLPDDEVILYTDSHDVVFLAGLDKIAEAYATFNHPFVASAEQNFNIISHPLFFYWINFIVWMKYPRAPKPYQYLNAGGFIGQVGYISNILDILQMTEETPCDQKILNQYLVQNPDAIMLDYEHRLFSCNGGRCGLENQDYAVVDSRLKNRITETYPCLLHIPGPCDIGFSKFSPYLEYISETPISDADLKQFKKKERMNRFVVKTLMDNFLVKFIIFNLICFTGILSISLICYYLFFRMS